LEQSLLMAVTRAVLEGEVSLELAAISSRPFDWAWILKQAEDERLAALLYSVARTLPVPSPVLERLRAAWVSGRRQYLLGIQQLTRVLSAFEREGVPVIPLRGLALANLLYRDPGLRPFTDLDLLVHEGNLPQALSLLSGLGYRHMEAGLPLSLELTWRHAASFVPEAPEENPIDLHWGMVDYPGLAPAAAITHQDFWDRAVRAEGPYGVHWELCPEDLLIYLALHWAVHHALSGLIWQLDLALLIARHGRASPRNIREVASDVETAPSPCPSPVTRCIGKSNGSPGEGIKGLCPSPGYPLGVGEGPQGVPGEGVSGSCELSGLDWEAVVGRAGRWRIRGPVFFALREVRDCLEAAVPAWVLDRLRPGGLRPTLFDWLRHRGKGRLERLDYLVPFLVMDRGSDILRALASAVVPPANWLRCRYGRASVLGAYMAHCARIGRVCTRTARASLGRAR
jgi:hypothetical protein